MKLTMIVFLGSNPSGVARGFWPLGPHTSAHNGARETHDKFNPSQKKNSGKRVHAWLVKTSAEVILITGPLNTWRMLFSQTRRLPLIERTKVVNPVREHALR